MSFAPSGAWGRLAAFVLVGAAAVAGYLPGLPGGFVYDDHRLIADNDGLKRPFEASRAFLRDYYASDFDRMGLGYYRPLAILSNEIDYRRGGGSPAAFHATNIALHAGASLLVLALGLLLFDGALAASTAAALLFALHPSHAESVAFISGRVDPLMALAALAAICLHLRGSLSPRPGPWRAAAGLAWFAALLSKEMAATVPVLVLLLETAREGWPRRADLARRAAGYIPFAVAAAAYASLRWIALGRLLGPATGTEPPSLVRPLAVTGSYLAWLAVPPWGLHLEPPPVAGIAAAAAALLVAVAAAGAVLLLRSGRRIEAALLGACLVSLLPVAQLRPIETTLSERFLYLPSAAAVLLLSAAALRIPRSRASRAAGGVALALLGAYYAGLLLQRSPLWRNELRLWTAKAEAEPSSLKAQLNLAEEYARLGERGKALSAFERARELGAPASLIDGEIASRLGGAAPDDRIATVRRALEASPSDGSLRSNLGFLLLEKGDVPGAAEAFEKAVEVTPARAEAWLGLAMARLRSKEVAGAELSARRAMALDPTLGLARGLVAECELRLGRPCEALLTATGLVLEGEDEKGALARVLAAARAGCGDGR